MKKLKLKQKYKNILIYLLTLATATLLLVGMWKIYQARYRQTNGQKPGSIEIFSK